ncbi:30S ribosomal protein S9 [Candidatus Kaiserbacteria bacterium]|nr:30S ribosomal protein S9 [Candidatus Kaiserbacteria bacterium]
MADFTHKEEYIETVGRRKTASARVRISKSESKNEVVINEKSLEEHFPTKELQGVAGDALKHSSEGDTFKVTAIIRGGGIHAQAEALRHGIARALVEYNAELRKALKKAGFLKRDPRKKERKKFGLKKARKSPQWSKR